MNPAPVVSAPTATRPSPMRLNNFATPVIAWTGATLLLGVLASALLTWWQTDTNFRTAQSAFETHSLEVVERLQDRVRAALASYDGCHAPKQTTTCRHGAPTAARTSPSRP